jgi:hypothetical protein
MQIVGKIFTYWRILMAAEHLPIQLAFISSTLLCGARDIFDIISPPK